MKNSLLFLVVVLSCIAAQPAASQHPLGEGQLLLGNGYFKPSEQEGDGTWRYIEARWLPKQRASTRFGLYLSAIEVASKIDDFNHHSTELGVGLAINFNFQPGWKYNKYGWSNIAWKQVNSNGSIRNKDGLFTNQQKDQILHLAGGLIFQNTLEQAFRVRQKVMLEYQTSLKNEYEGNWNNTNVPGLAWNKEQLKMSLENAIFKSTLSWRNEVYFLPAILLAYSHEKALKQDFIALGVILTLAKGEYNQEIINFSYQSKFCLTGGRIDIFEVNLDLINIWKTIN